MESSLLWGIALLAAAYFIGRYEASKKFSGKIEKLEEAVAHRSQQILLNLRRELSNDLISVNQERFEKLFEWARKYEEFTNSLSAEEMRRELSQINGNFEFLSQEEQEFYESMNGAGYGNWSENFSTSSWMTVDDLEQKYYDLVKFMVLIRKTNLQWSFCYPPIGDSDLNELVKYLQELSDAKFVKRIFAAVEEFDHNPDKRLRGPDGSHKIFETDSFIIFYVHDYVAHRCFGVQFKNTLEYGIYKKYLFDDFATPPREEVFRCDSNFEKEKILYYPGSVRQLRKRFIRTSV